VIKKSPSCGVSGHCQNNPVGVMKLKSKLKLKSKKRAFLF